MKILKNLNPPIACRQAAVAQHLLAQSLKGRMLPDILGYLVNPAEVVILLPHRTRAPEGFQEMDEGYSWLLTRSAAKELAEGQPSVLGRGQRNTGAQQHTDPLVIHAGSHLETQSEMLLDVSQLSHLSVRGSTERVMSAMGSFAMDLLSNPFRSDLRIYIVGFGHEFEMFPQVSVFERQSDVSSLLREGALRNGQASKTAVRQMDIVMDPFTENSDELETVSGVSLFTSFGSAAWSLDLEGSRTSLQPLDISLQRGVERSPSMVPYSTFQKLLPKHDAKEPDAMRLDFKAGAFADKPPKRNQHSIRARFQNLNSKLQDFRLFPKNSRFFRRAIPRDIKVSVMGPVSVDGAAPFLTQQCVDFVCYLAFHREGVTCDMVKESMWSNGSTPENRTVTALASRSRNALGTDTMNRLHIPRFGADKVYRLSQTVCTDFDEFSWHIRRVRSDSPAAIVHLRRALRLVRGAPFSGAGRNRYGWADMSVRTHIECMVDDAAHRLADIALQLGDPDTARWACYQAHKVVPGCEQCYLRRFHAAHLARNPMELRSAMSELQQIIRTDDGFCVSSALAQSYERLLAEM